MASISSTIARQIGSLQGKLVSQIQSEVLKLLKKFSNECPTPKELEKIIKTRNTLIKHLNSFQKRVNKFSSVANRLQKSIATIRSIIRILKAIPIPTAIIPPMSGGIGIPIKILNTYSDALIKLNKILDKLVDEVAAIKSLIGSITPVIANLKARLNSIDVAIQKCSVSQPGGVATVLPTAQPEGNTGSEGTPSEDYLYKGYKLAIIQDVGVETIAPRRYATATDNRGIVVLRGPLSFSSSTQVLLDEIKFRIDNQLA